MQQALERFHLDTLAKRIGEVQTPAPETLHPKPFTQDSKP